MDVHLQLERAFLLQQEKKKPTREMLVTSTLHVWRNMRVPKSEIHLFTKQTVYFTRPFQ
jgi:hypothetical protein